MRSFICTFLFFFACLNVFGQQETFTGLVFDKDTKQRLARVRISNLRSQETIYNNSKGEFSLVARKGDLLLARLENYRSDTVKVGNQGVIIFYLKRLAIPLPQVTVKDSLLSAKERYEQAKKAFNQAVRLGNNQDLLAVGQSGGVGLSIDAIWSAFSKEGKNARRLMEVMERDYQNNMIDQIFNKTLVQRITGLKGDRLLIFMLNYRPTYDFVMKANDYVLASYIKMAYQKFMLSADAQDLSDLKPIGE